MTTPSPVATLIDLARSGGMDATIDQPERREGTWWIDLRRGAAHEEIEWHHERGFGLYASDAGFGSRPERFTDDPAEALRLTIGDGGLDETRPA